MNVAADGWFSRAGSALKCRIQLQDQDSNAGQAGSRHHHDPVRQMGQNEPREETNRPQSGSRVKPLKDALPPLVENLLVLKDHTGGDPMRADLRRLNPRAVE